MTPHPTPHPHAPLGASTLRAPARLAAPFTSTPGRFPPPPGGSVPTFWVSGGVVTIICVEIHRLGKGVPCWTWDVVQPILRSRNGLVGAFSREGIGAPGLWPQRDSRAHL